MEAYVAGDAGAFERLFRSLAPSVHAFFVRSVGPGAVAEDLLQSTFLKMHVARASWRGGERLRPWVFTIAGRVRIDWLRKQGREVQEGDDEVMDPEARDAGEAVLAGQRAERVRVALDGLAEPQRVVVYLHRFEELGFAEIGRVLGISEGAAKLRAFRAYEQLRVALADLVAEDRS
ncbi:MULTISPECIES: RNA polymerase sigma factor [unclassified Anaeromyxobacter]|uniref:RNA polymerase sigma factor n=1 Tax=unclassified Anaeromyxobacter TaxID=2620896 RepID=UPI001F5A4A98|nr:MULTISPECIES: RNA polymerase sigma factor [unclassified Anaeromyxobacter]